MIKRVVQAMGEDHVIMVMGGRGHIGSHVSAIPYEREGIWHVTLQTWNQIGHKDDEVAKRYASAMALCTHHIAVCICGIHFDDLTADDIQAIIAWCEQDIKQLKEEWYNG